MRFKGTPGLKLNIHKPKYGEPSAIRFDENGIFETHNKFLARRLINRKYEIVPEPPAQPEQPEQPATASFPCKKCQFSTDNKGLLMAHYRAEHPKQKE